MGGNESSIKGQLEELLSRLSVEVKHIPEDMLPKFASNAMNQIGQIASLSSDDNSQGNIEGIVDARYIGDEKSILVDTYTQRAYINGVNAKLTPHEYIVLVHLMRNSGRLVKNPELLAAIAPSSALGHYNSDNLVKEMKRNLRMKLGEFAGYIATHRGIGIRYDGPVFGANIIGIALMDYDDKLAYADFSVGPDGAVRKRGTKLGLYSGGHRILRRLLEMPQQRLELSEIGQIASNQPDGEVSLTHIHKLIRGVRVAIGDDPYAPKYLLKVETGYILDLKR